MENILFVQFLLKKDVFAQKSLSLQQKFVNPGPTTLTEVQISGDGH